jgi:hypothetical protein
MVEAISPMINLAIQEAENWWRNEFAADKNYDDLFFWD